MKVLKVLEEGNTSSDTNEFIMWGLWFKPPTSLTLLKERSLDLYL